METVVEEATAQARFEMLLFLVFAGVALALAAAGIYGVMSHAVQKRTREIGIRMSLGASRGAVLGMVARQTMREALVGTALVAALGPARRATRIEPTVALRSE